MSKKLKNFGDKIVPYAVPGIITLAVMVVIYIFKGIWPFGTNRIDYFDNMQQVAPLYAHLWDWLHGKASLWFDWYTGLGTNVSMSISAFSMLSPFNLLLYLIPRNLILESISIVTIIKMIFMAVAMYAYLDKKFKGLCRSMKTTFALMYAFCGYTILYASCFTPWMDIVALFPVLMIAYERMMEKGRKLFYICMVALCFIINYYLSAMILVYIFIISGVYILVCCERKKWKMHAWNLGIGTVAGIGLSCFVFVPVMFQLSGSQRGSSANGLLSQYAGWLSGSIVNDGSMGAFQRWMMLYGLAFAVAVIIVGLRKFRSEKKTTLYLGLLTLTAVAPMVVEGTNLIWHFGSYNGYTLRNGFLVSFTLITVAATYGERIFGNIALERVYMLRQIVIAMVLCAAYAVGYHFIPDNNEIFAIIFFMAIFVTMTIVYIRKLLEEKTEFNCKSVIAVIAVEVFIGTYALVGPPKFYTYEDYQIGDYVQYANTVYEDLAIEDSAVDRIVNPDISLNANYPLILRRGAMSSFTAALQSDTQMYSKNFGYSKYFLWLLDSGGTVFTNALFHVTEAVNINALDSELFTKIRQAGDYSLYRTNYQLPFAMCVNSAFAKTDFSNEWIGLHNQFYQALSDDDELLVKGLSYNRKVTDTTVEYMADVVGKQAVYISIADINNGDNDANCSWMMSGIHIYMNDTPVLIPTLGNVKNTAYFTDYNNNLVYLGCFEDETIHIRIEYDDPWYLSISEVKFAGLDMRKMQSLTESYKDTWCDVSYTNNTLTVKLRATAKKNLALIPVIYSDNWTVTVDGQQTNASAVAGLFTGVRVHSGENTIVMTFDPKGRKEGLLISLGTLLLLLVCVVINHFKRINVPKWMQYIALFIYLQLYNIVVVAMFLLPSIAAVPVFIYQLVIKLSQLF